VKFFYNLERYEEGEYVVVMLEENDERGIGAIVPERSKGENYKTIMGVIEEYRHVVEKARPEHFSIISQRLEEEFPRHPKVTFAISAAAFELFAKLSGMSLRGLLMVNGLKGAVSLNEWNGDIVIPEETGGVIEAISLGAEDRALLLREYPRSEMEEVLKAISSYYAGYVSSKW
jgi:hypothetical protein